MYPLAKPSKRFIAWEWILAFLPSLLSAQVFGFTALSFEDHLVTIACMHVLWWVFIPMRFAKPRRCELGGLCRYGLGWLLAFSISQCLAALILGHCEWREGLTWLALLLWPSGIFLLGLFYALCKRTSSTWRCRFALLLTLILLSLPNLLDFLLTPTMWAYHFSVGYIPGPLFDAWIPQWDALFWFRIWTLGMGIFFFVNARRFHIWTILLCTPFLFRTDVGFRSTHASVQEALGRIQHSQYAQIITNHDLRLPLSKTELASVDDLIQNLSQSLHVSPPQKPVRIYVYEDPILKKKLTGTHWTMIGNPMQHSLHLVHFSPSDSLLPHELSHVISKPMGLPWIGTGRNIALTEGLAMAMQQEYGFLPMDQWAAYMLSQNTLPSTAALFSNVSFFQNNATRSYNAAGSFIQWLMATHSIESFSVFYATSNAQKAYDLPLSILESQWHAYLQSIDIDPTLIQKMRPALNRPPVFLEKCVHVLASLQYVYQYQCQTLTCKSRMISRARACSPDDPWANHQYVEDLLQQPDTQASELASWLTHPDLSLMLKQRIRHALSLDWQTHASETELWLWDQNPTWLIWYWRGLYDFIDQITATPPDAIIWTLVQALDSQQHAPQLNHLANQIKWLSGTPVQQTQLHRKMLRLFEYLGQPDQALAWLLARPPSSAIGQAWYEAQVRRLKNLQPTVLKTKVSPAQTEPRPR